MSNSFHQCPQAVPYYSLNVAEPFKELTIRQRLYAHYMLRASWAGFSICVSQVSPESLPILKHFFNFFSIMPSLAKLRKKVEKEIPGLVMDEYNGFLEYVAMVYSNGGNYLAFGDSKIVPRCKPETIQKIFDLYEVSFSPNLLHDMYDLRETRKTLDFPNAGASGYYSHNITKEDALLANEFLCMKGLDGSNTRVMKDTKTGDLEIRIAAANIRTVPAEEFGGRQITLYYGDFHVEMRRVVDALKNARRWAENTTQGRMLDHYIRHFEHGNIEDHKDAQREWVRDLGPTVETNLGFIESYRDPSGVRAEWEGFVSIVNKSQSKRYAALVNAAEKFIPLLPWGKSFEKDTFTSPDFTSLDILGFATSGIPAGICIPNYDDIRQSEGFKNVYLSNVVNAFNATEKLLHITENDWELFKQHFVDATSVNVGVHELLGHGTGKLFMQFEDGTKNFDENIIDPISHEKVNSFYLPGDTFGTVFGGIGSAYEECRAEAVALYLGTNPDVLRIFNVVDPEAQRRTIHVLWLNMVRAGLVGLEYYSPESQQWRQAHMRARFCILITLLRWKPSNPLLSIYHHPTEGVRIEIDPERIETEGRAAIGELLVHLCVNKALANAKRGVKYFEDLTMVSNEFVHQRELIMFHRKPRKQFVQPHTVLLSKEDRKGNAIPSSGTGDETKEVNLVEFDPSVEGAIEAMVFRHRDIPL